MKSSPNKSTSSLSPSAPPVALPSNEALELLLSPDGYYTYLSIPKPDPSTYLTPQFLNNTDTTANNNNNNNSTIDLDQVKKNYRRLSLKHHPDRPGGNEETFRALNRAKVVLSSAKLRREYDLIGLDLEDDAEEHTQEDGDGGSSEDHRGGEGEHQGHDNTHTNANNNNGNNNKTDTVMSHLASATLAGVLQMFVRTVLMGVVSVLLSRYAILTILTVGMLVFLSTRLYSAVNTKVAGVSWRDVSVPLLIAVGVYFMFRGRRSLVESDDHNGDEEEEEEGEVRYHSWTWTFWLGETLVMTLFLANSFEKRSPALLALFTTGSGLFALWLRGHFWRYATLLGFQGVIALLVVLAFPIMEMILEQIVEEKMRKVGEKIRAHDARLRELQRVRNESGVSLD